MNNPAEIPSLQTLTIACNIAKARDLVRTDPQGASTIARDAFRAVCLMNGKTPAPSAPWAIAADPVLQYAFEQSQALKAQYTYTKRKHQAQIEQRHREHHPVKPLHHGASSSAQERDPDIQELVDLKNQLSDLADMVGLTFSPDLMQVIRAQPKPLPARTWHLRPECDFAKRKTGPTP